MYYFDTDDEHHLVIDDEGVNLPDHDAAQQMALEGLRDLGRKPISAWGGFQRRRFRDSYVDAPFGKAFMSG